VAVADASYWNCAAASSSVMDISTKDTATDWD
jgi:hypothetical protein